MKPKEFDELIRQKFDQGDFAYKPQNWDKLAEQMEGRSKKRGMYLWLGIPLAGMAASVAMAMGVSVLMKHDAVISSKPAIAKVMPRHKASVVKQSSLSAETAPVVAAQPANNNIHIYEAPGSKAHDNASQVTEKPSDGFAIKMQDEQVETTMSIKEVFPAAKEKINTEKTITENKKKALVFNDWYNDLPDEPTRKVSRGISLLLSGGVNYGKDNSGYMAGAAIRKMVSDKVFVEGNIAFATSSNVQKTEYMVYNDVPQTPGIISGAAAKTSGRVDTMASRFTPPPAPVGTIKERDVPYNLYYVQVTPSLGYKLAKKLSVGGGADFQKALVDNRPELSDVDRGNLQVAPMFDIGLIGKTEYAIAKRVTAAVYYRKGINNVITPTNKYIDRDYLQFQVKCTIFNK